MQGFNAFHGQRVGSAAIAEATMGIVDVLRSIHADACHDSISPEAIAPGVVDQRGVGLDVLGEVQSQSAMVGKALIKDLGGFVVPAGGESEWLSRMPDE